MEDKAPNNKIRKIIDVVVSSKVRRIIYRGREYFYIYNPISTGIYPVEPDVVDAIADIMSMEMKRLGKIDYILTFEAMGIHIGTALSLKTRIPLLIARKKRYLDEMIEVRRESDSLYLPAAVAGMSIVIVDSILSTGTTILETIKTLKKHGSDIKGVFVAIERKDYNGAERIKEETGIDIWSLVKIRVSDEGVELCRSPSH